MEPLNLRSDYPFIIRIHTHQHSLKAASQPPNWNQSSPLVSPRLFLPSFHLFFSLSPPFPLFLLSSFSLFSLSTFIFPSRSLSLANSFSLSSAHSSGFSSLFSYFPSPSLPWTTSSFSPSRSQKTLRVSFVYTFSVFVRRGGPSFGCACIVYTICTICMSLSFLVPSCALSSSR